MVMIIADLADSSEPCLYVCMCYLLHVPLGKKYLVLLPHQYILVDDGANQNIYTIVSVKIQ